MCRKFYRLLVPFLLVVITSCFVKKEKIDKKEIKEVSTSPNDMPQNIEIILRSPGGCIQYYEIDKEGYGRYLIGRASNQDMDTFKVLEEVKTVSFKLQKQNLSDIILQLENMTKDYSLSSKNLKDAYHFEVKSGNSKVLDTYGDPGNAFNNLMSEIIINTKAEYDQTCW